MPNPIHRASSVSRISPRILHTFPDALLEITTPSPIDNLEIWGQGDEPGAARQCLKIRKVNTTCAITGT